MADKYNIQIDCGATYKLIIEWQNEDGTYVNLTGYKARMKLKHSYSTEALVSLTNLDGITLRGASGQVVISIPPEKTRELVGTGVYDVELESPGGEVTRILEGTWVAIPEVTD